MNKPLEYLAIVIDLEEPVKSNATQAWQILNNQFSIKFISSHSPAPHLTIASGLTGEPDLLYSKLHSLLSDQSSFEICSNGLGIFVADSPVLYIRWLINQELACLQSCITKFAVEYSKSLNISTLNDHLNWVAKTTLAYKDIKYSDLPEVLNSLMEIDFNKSMPVRSLSIYSYDNHGNEVCLFTIELK